MKKLLAPMILSALVPFQSQAFIREIAACTTSDGYTINVVDKEQLGPHNPAPTMSASIKDANDQVVAAYENVEIYRGSHSISFGRQPIYMDSETQGQNFSLQGFSTNAHNYVITAKINVNGEVKTLQSTDLDCSVFNGEILH